MIEPGAKAQLYLDGKPVGTVVLQNRRDSWCFGQFTPDAAFSEFAPRFGRWSLIMHEDEDQALSAEAAAELRSAEKDLSRIRAKLFFHEHSEWRRPTVLTIDGPLIEWKEF